MNGKRQGSTPQWISGLEWTQWKRCCFDSKIARVGIEPPPGFEVGTDGLRQSGLSKGSRLAFHTRSENLTSSMLCFVLCLQLCKHDCESEKQRDGDVTNMSFTWGQWAFFPPLGGTTR